MRWCANGRGEVGVAWYRHGTVTNELLEAIIAGLVLEVADLGPFSEGQYRAVVGRDVQHDLRVRRDPHGPWTALQLDVDVLMDLAYDLLELREQRTARGEGFEVLSVRFTPHGVHDLRLEGSPAGLLA